MTDEQTKQTPEAGEHRLDGRTKRALDTAIAKRQVSQESYRAVEEGRITLAEAKELGREGSPDGPATKPLDKDSVNSACLCGCGRVPAGKRARWIPGHDARAIAWAKAVVRGEDIELSEEQIAYIETSGKLEKAKARVAEEDQRKAEREAAKAEKAAQKERRKQREGKTTK